MIFHEPKSHMHLISRGLLSQGDDFILCHIKGSDWFFLPGGHIENGESAKTALIRELEEEIGFNKYEIESFIGVCENIFLREEDKFQHEINIIFKVKIPEDIDVKSIEDHIEFVKVKKEELKNYKILPNKIKEGIIDWLDSKKSFFKEI